MKLTLTHLAVVVLFVVAAAAVAAANDTPSYTRIGHDIHIAANQKTGELTCINCSIYVRGQVAGDVTTVRGTIVVEGDGAIAGDVTAIVGDVRAASGAKVAGDLTAVGGTVRRQSDATIAGDVTSLEGPVWPWLVFGSPIVLLGGLIALIVWLVQRRKTPAAPLARAA